MAFVRGVPVLVSFGGGYNLHRLLDLVQSYVTELNPGYRIETVDIFDLL
jgi:hypothetical protein